MRIEFVHTFIPRRKSGRDTVLLLHATGGSENDLVPMGRAIAPNAALLGVRGKVIENGATRFYRKKRDMHDTEDLIFRTNELADFIALAGKDYDLQRVIALGYSNGANMAAALLLLRQKAISGALLFRPSLPLVPVRLPDLAGKPVFLSAGTDDKLVSRDKTQDLIAVLKDAHADLRVFWQNGGHELHSQEIDSARRWVSEKFP